MNLLDNKYYRKALEIIASGKLSSLENGKHVIDGENLFINVCDSDLKTPEQARFEAHRKYIDIQVPLSGEESYGVMPVGECKEQDGEFNTEKDIVFFKDKVSEKTIYTAQSGQSVVFSPEDAHAPLIGKGKIHKAIFKVIVMSLCCTFIGIACTNAQEQKVMARFVPERYDDFAFENNLIAGRIYGEALESCGKGQITSPGIDVWVKVPGNLIANKFYEDDLQNHKSYHKNWGEGKDCYKVGRSLGAGASAPLIGGKLALPATNYRSYEILEETAVKVVFVLNYPEWEFEGTKLALSKKITVTPDTYFVQVEDSYTFSGDSLVVAAGVNRHAKQDILYAEDLKADRYAIWEGASDQSSEKDPDSRVGVAVLVPGATLSCIAEDGSHALLGKTLKSGETFCYSFGSCWNGGNIKSAEEWLKLVAEQGIR